MTRAVASSCSPCRRCVARDVVRALGPHLDGHHFVVHGVRRSSWATATGGRAHLGRRARRDAGASHRRARRPRARLGPAGRSHPSVMVCGSHYPEVNRALRQAFGRPRLRLYATTDLLGLEWASALVGCLAIGVGYARGVGLGPGLLAARHHARRRGGRAPRGRGRRKRAHAAGARRIRRSAGLHRADRAPRGAPGRGAGRGQDAGAGALAGEPARRGRRAHRRIATGPRPAASGCRLRGAGARHPCGDARPTRWSAS